MRQAAHALVAELQALAVGVASPPQRFQRVAVKPARNDEMMVDASAASALFRGEYVLEFDPDLAIPPLERAQIVLHDAQRVLCALRRVGGVVGQMQREVSAREVHVHDARQSLRRVPLVELLLDLARRAASLSALSRLLKDRIDITVQIIAAHVYALAVECSAPIHSPVLLLRNCSLS